MFGIPSLDELLPPTLQSEEDKQLQDELEMLVERLGVSHDVDTSGYIFGSLLHVASFHFGATISM